jgi:nucleotide-binding universal stress UspA family protein
MASKVLIATDGSKYSRMAVEYGVGLAKKLGEGVIGLYVVNMKSLEMFALGHHDDIGGYEAAVRSLSVDGEKALEYVASAGKNAGVDVTTKLVRGYPAEEIIKLASGEDISLIVVGNLGKTGLEHLLLGSVSEAVVKKAPCPVLVVRGSVTI